MTEVELLLDDIEKLRSTLQNLIKDNDNLLDPEIIKASRNLNQAIVSYENLINEKRKG
ncbi:MAG: aspartyl-phosphate phosphatase Spo0E family protein [Firmicutes bacterium]|nr:aspartyl-phosphate phosphatase Spo0E family protein [Bacillota bacterium]